MFVDVLSPDVSFTKILSGLIRLRPVNYNRLLVPRNSDAELNEVMLTWRL